MLTASIIRMMIIRSVIPEWNYLHSPMLLHTLNINLVPFHVILLSALVILNDFLSREFLLIDKACVKMYGCNSKSSVLVLRMETESFRNVGKELIYLLP
jgi:hypothetical protein